MKRTGCAALVAALAIAPPVAVALFGRWLDRQLARIPGWRHRT